MTTSHQQQALIRKVIYTVMILALITLSLLHRRLGVEPMANDLQLREVARGEVELTSSAVRLMLTGSRGLAVTFLWHSAMKKQEKHEWNELELLVGSITKLQPHFISPWLFQSWNLSFNVAVECDRPRDKYYYISRGIEMLAEGERRNHKPPAPGHPDMRHHMGFTYQLKIGNSDEKNVMRSLLELSCIDPIQRDAGRFWTITQTGKEVKLTEFADFCAKYPRLVRRLREKLPYDTPAKIVGFLEDHREIPSRFEKPTGGAQQKQTPLKDPNEQFPLLPPRMTERSPDPRNPVLSPRDPVDVFLMSRTWYEYAQIPLPEPDRDFKERQFITSKYRKPRYMMIEIFRGYPSRAQAYIAEALQEDGWFDEDGWVVRDWFDKLRGPNDPEFRVGSESLYHSGPAWEDAYQRYLDYGTKTGLYLSPGEVAELEEKAKPFRASAYAFRSDLDALAGQLREPAMAASFAAHRKLTRNRSLRDVTNFDAHLNQAEAERRSYTVHARKLFFQAERMRRFENPERALDLYQEVWPLWTQVLLAHPQYAKIWNVQEEAYELALNSMRLSQKQRPQVFKAVAIGTAQLGLRFPLPLDKLLDDQEKSKILPIREVRGPLEWTMIYEGENAEGLKTALASWTQATGFGMRFLTPVHIHAGLSRSVSREAPVPQGWRTLIDRESVDIVRSRIGLAPTTPKKESATPTP